MTITVENVSKRFGTFQALEDINLEVKDGGLVALLGPSGSGKSTLLRVIAGLEQPDTGRILLTGKDATYQSVQDRQVGFVFQHYALFKHLTIRKNIAFGLEIQKWPRDRVEQRVDELLDLIQLRGLGNRYPSQLSGGQRQRVALARALAVQPRVLLLDEPFGALDAKVRKDLRDWLRQLHDEVHVTTVFVTHDQEEAMEISDEIVVMNHGRIEQVGHPADVYDRPASPFVMSFIGAVNILPGTSPLATPGQASAGESIFLRPQDITIYLEPTGQARPAKVIRITHLGWEIQVELGLEDGQRLMALVTRSELKRLQLQPQQPVFIDFESLHTFASHSNAYAPVAVS